MLGNISGRVSIKKETMRKRRVVLGLSRLPHPPSPLCWGFKSLSGQGCHLLSTIGHLLPPTTCHFTLTYPLIRIQQRHLHHTLAQGCPPVPSSSCLSPSRPHTLQRHRHHLEHLSPSVRSVRLVSVGFQEYHPRDERKGGMRKARRQGAGRTSVEFWLHGLSS